MNDDVCQRVYNLMIHNRLHQSTNKIKEILKECHPSTNDKTTQAVTLLTQNNILSLPDIQSLPAKLNHIPKYQRIQISNLFPDFNTKESVWLYRRGLTDIPTCITCDVKSTRWSERRNGYTLHCSNSCRALDPQVEEKRKATCIEKYGHDKSLTSIKHQSTTRESCNTNNGAMFPFQQDSIQHKGVVSKIQRFGDDYKKVIAAKASDALNAKYGGSGFGEAMNHPTIKAKWAQSKLQRTHEWWINRMKSIKDDFTPLYTISDYINVSHMHPYECNACHNTFEDDLFGGSVPRCPTCIPYRSTNFLENEISQYIVDELGIGVILNDRSLIAPLELDVYIAEYNLAIEFNGLYWHSEFGSHNRVDSTYHLNKSQKCLDKNVRLVHIFEDEWVNKKDIVKSILSQSLGKNKTIQARKCEIKEVEVSTATTFLQENHIQGHSSSSSITLGAYYGDDLVQLMSFGKSRYNKNIQWELHRLCSLKYTSVLGGANKIFKHFEREYSPQSIISYADIRLFAGVVYDGLGFEHSHNTKPGYYYVNTKKCDERLNRLQFQKHKLHNVLDSFDATMTEHENMIVNGYSKIWDCGQAVFTKKYYL